MTYDYDALYKEMPSALGPPSADVVRFFSGFEDQSLTVLDIGCGQGRDALYLGRLGHRVSGVDLSPSGIADLNAEAMRDGLPVTGQVADVRTVEVPGLFDVILFDRTLHMLSKSDQLRTLTRLIDQISANGWVVILDERSNLDGFKSVFKIGPEDWQIVSEKRGTLILRRR